MSILVRHQLFRYSRYACVCVCVCAWETSALGFCVQSGIRKDRAGLMVRIGTLSSQLGNMMDIQMIIV